MLLYRDATHPKKPSALPAGVPRIGLALSGGGFRASIFHLGVIRRLEELGIMPRVNVISAVSGGSIIAAYYVCEMENKLRSLKPCQAPTVEDRVGFFESIADEFLKATDYNLRTRALVYTPFFHTYAFVKTLLSRPFRQTARSELIQREYDRWFYNDNTLDELPSVTPDNAPPDSHVLYGPKLILNSTSLISGERVSFSRQPVSKLMEMSKVNRNVLPLSRVVGASSCVPGLFPPTSIAGDILVDGGVSDNQGIEGLIEEGGDCDILIVSDASGQMEEVNRVSTGELSVLSRVNETLQFQVRAKLLEILRAWKDQRNGRELAFVHLFLNLKDRQEEDRLPSEYIPGVARIRTDLDQFSYIETESLMYHGYTLIDAQLKSNCPQQVPLSAPRPMVPPLFQHACPEPEKRRKAIRKDLKAGAQSVFLLRSAEKYWQVRAILGLGWSAGVALLVLVLYVSRKPLEMAVDVVENAIDGLIPAILRTNLDKVLTALGLADLSATVRGVSGIVALLALLGIALYLVSFPVYVLVRWYALRMDRSLYRELTRTDWSTHWRENEPEGSERAAAAGKT